MLNIILIEDNILDVDLFNEYIEEYHHEYNISTFQRLRSAIEYVENNNNVDLILLDLNLPDSNGIATFNKIMEIRGNIPIIVMTGINDQLLAKQTISNGAGDYLVKNKLSPYVIHKSITHTIEREKNKQLMKLKERQILQKQKMAAIGRLAGGIAHDFNNLLSIINGYSELLLAQSKQLGFSEKVTFQLQEIVRAGQSGAGLINQLLMFSRKKELTKEVVNLADFIHQMKSMMSRIAPSTISIEITTDGDDLSVEINPTHLEQIILNIVINAVDAINESTNKNNGRIKLNLSSVIEEKKDSNNKDQSVEAEFVQLAISDNGTGMDEETQKKIFDPFFTTKDIDKGTGLGLATTYGILKNNGGTIIVDSSPGKGTTFDIHLPKIIGTKAEHIKTIESSNGSLNEEDRVSYKIMIVEDNQPLRLMISNVLNQLGYQIISHSNANEAKIFLENKGMNSIDLIITDVVMPEMNGIEFYKWVLTNFQDVVPFIFISGYNEEIPNISDHLNQLVSYLEKPFSMSEIRNIVDRLIMQLMA